MLHEFYLNKKVLITGHTGFKGSWLALWLKQLGASVHGLALEPLSSNDHFVATGLESHIQHSVTDIRDLGCLKEQLAGIQPEIVFHLAAQPIVLDSYTDPILTYETNAMGTANLLEAVRSVESVKSIVVITTDKCYENREWDYAYRENDALGGHDPYSSSKAAAEIIAQSYYRSFFKDKNMGLATARAGNVIGGGDWQEHRLIPDLMRAHRNDTVLQIRNPKSVRPWQHVLEPLYGYLSLGQTLFEAPVQKSGAYNFGPAAEASVQVDQVMDIAARKLKTLSLVYDKNGQRGHEAKLLLLDSSKAARQLSWRTHLTLEQTIGLTIDWYQAQFNDGDLFALSCEQIRQYEELVNND